MKPVQITEFEWELIMLCKNKHDFSLEEGSTIIDLLGKFYEKHYVLDYKEYKSNFYSCMFNVMFKFYYKVYIENSNKYNSHSIYNIISLFNVSFSKTFIRDQELPIERTIMELYGMIQCIQVVDVENNFNVFEIA